MGECEAEDARSCANRTLRRLVGFVASALDVRFAFVVAFNPPGEPQRGTLWLARDYGLRSTFAEFDVPENEEMKRLLVHGLLHLAGMDHGRGRGGAMLALQEKLLDTLRSERIYGEKLK